jgi:hypothetical protein
MTFEFEYLGEFTFKFKNFLYPETGSQTGSIDEKKLRSKISCKCTFKRRHGHGHQLEHAARTVFDHAALAISKTYYQNAHLCSYYALTVSCFVSTRNFSEISAKYIFFAISFRQKFAEMSPR